MKRVIERVFGRGDRAVIDLGIRHVNDRAIERFDGARVAGLALAPVDLESLDPDQVAALNSAMSGLLAGLEAPIQLLVSNNKFDSDRYLARTVARWRADWNSKNGLRERLATTTGDPEAWTAFVDAAAADLNLRQIKVRLMLTASRVREGNQADLDDIVERIGSGLSQAGITWRAMSGLELVLELERAFLHGGGTLANALAAGGPVRLIEGLENLAFDLADPLPDWIEFGTRQLRFPQSDGERFCAAGYLRALPRAVQPGWLALPARFDFDMTLSLHVGPLPQAEVMRRVAQSEREIAGALEDAGDSDPVAAREQRWRAEDVGALADAMRGRERYFKLGAYYLIGAGDREELDKHRRTLTSALAGIGLVGSNAFGYQQQALQSVLPLADERLVRRRGITSAPLAAAHPGSGRGRADPDGWLLAACGWDKGPRAPFLFNPFADIYENPHVAVLGQSGAGKTHLARAIAYSAWLVGRRSGADRSQERIRLAV